MVNVQAINNPYAIYNGVKIKVNNPQTNIPNHIKNNNGEYNSVSIEVNTPELNIDSPVFSYPKRVEPITSDKTSYKVGNKKNLPIIPVAYQTNLINNRTFINAELEIKNKINDKIKSTVPPPNITTTEAEKKTENISFNGLSFKGNEPKIDEPAKIESSIDINRVIKNLSDEDFDIQALQLENIAKSSMEETQKAFPYITTQIFSTIIDIINKDTSGLEGPTEKQKEIRKKIIANEFALRPSKDGTNSANKTEEPFKLTPEELSIANSLSQLEKAERNKVIAVYTLATLARIYSDEIERKTGNVVPLTDMPGVSTLVDVLKTSRNVAAKIAAIDAFLHIKRNEYNDEIKSILQIVTQDANEFTARCAAEALAIIG